MNQTEREEFAVMKNEISHIKNNISELKCDTKSNFEELKAMLEGHIKWESEKYDDLRNDFASKWVEKAIIAVMTSVVGGVILAVVFLI